MSLLLNDISIKLEHQAAEDVSYGAMTEVTAEILLQQKTIGTISATLVNRQAIPENCFYETADEHSSDMQWIVCALLENRFGRTKLQSLVESDHTEFDFMYISTFHVDCSVGAIALQKFLRHPFIRGDERYDSKESSAAYALDVREAMSPSELEQHYRTLNEERNPALRPDTNQRNREDRRLNEIARGDANQFIRNGFAQDPALAKGGGANARIPR